MPAHGRRRHSLERAVEVWPVRLDAPRDISLRLSGALSDDEWERAGRLRAVDDRRRFVTCRGLVRTILAHYVGSDPARLRFAYAHGGKPRLSGPGRELEFSVAHSGDVAVVACTHGRRVGVDLEEVRPFPDLEETARRFLSAPEQATLRRFAPAQRARAFYSCWTRKEAYLKATGEGLKRPLDSFAVTFSAADTPALTWVGGAPTEAARWRMEALDVGESTVGAVVAEAGEWRLRPRRIAELGAGLDDLTFRR